VRRFLMTKLFIDTATKAMILTLQVGEDFHHRFDLTGNEHSEKLMPAIENLFKETGHDIKEVDEFYIGSGPGSYTGVRIGVTVAKMFAYTLKKPIYNLSSLQVIASSYSGQADYLIPIIDARRNNVFASIYQDVEGELVEVLEEGLYGIEELIEKAKALDSVIFVGLDTKNFQTSFENNQISYQSNLAQAFDPQKLMMQKFEQVHDIHGFSPNYKRITEAERNLK
jgi:tRNA threonylcarbamoyladenosine biosynthesis protein TsaB